jgi:transcriptional regulator with XRE-family HTH domain
MNNRNLFCRLRTQRRAWALSQRELAELLGGRSPTHIARIEAGKRIPSIEIALACQVLFGMPPETLFPNVYTEIEERMMQNIYRFREGLLQTTSPSVVRKQELLENARKRALIRLNTSGV